MRCVRLIVALLLVLAAHADAQSVAVEIDGETVTLTQLDATIGPLKTALDAASDAAAKKAIREEYDLRLALRRQMFDVENIHKRQRELEQARSERNDEIESARAAAAKPEVPTELSEDQFLQFQARTRDAETNIQRIDGVRTTKTDAVEYRRQRLTSANAELQALRTTRNAIEARKARPDLNEESARGIQRELILNELTIRRLELERDHHKPLLTVADADAALADLNLKLAHEESNRAAKLLTLAGEVRRAQLADEQAQAKEKADRARMEAARETQLAFKAVKILRALEAEFEARSKVEKADLTEITTLETRWKRRLSAATKKNAEIAVRLPKNETLTKFKRSYLLAQQRRLDERSDTIGGDAERMLPRMENRRRDVIEQTDRLSIFAERLEEFRNTRDDEVDLDTESFGTEEDVLGRFFAARRDHAKGIAELRADDETFLITYAQRQWDEAFSRLMKITNDRLSDLEPMGTMIDDIVDSIDDTESLLNRRREHLREVSLWLRDAPPLSGEELRFSKEEISQLPDALRSAIVDLRDRLAKNGLGPGAAAGLLAVIAAFGFVLRGKLRRRLDALPPSALEVAGKEEVPSAELTAAHQTVVLRRLSQACLERAAPWIVILAGIVAIHLIWARGNGLIYAVEILLAAGTVRVMARHGIGRIVGGIKGYRALVRCTEKTARSAKQLTWLFTAALVFLLPLMVLMREIGLPRLGNLFELLLAFSGLATAVALAFRRDVLTLVLPPEERGAYARAMHRVVRFLWPLTAIFFVGVFCLHLAGYRNAAIHLATRSLLCVGVLILGGIVSRLLRAVIITRTTPDEEDETQMEAGERNIAHQRLEFFRKVLLVVLGMGTFLGMIVAISASLGISRLKWSEIAAIPFLGERSATTLGDFFYGVIVFIGTVIVAGVVRDLLQLGLKGRALKRGSRYAISTLTFYVIVTIGTIFTLRSVGIYLSELGWLLAPAGVALGFGLTEILSNFVSGIILFIERPVQVGDIVTVGDVEGDVKGISIRSTVVRTRDGISIIIPNKRLITENVINWSHGDSRTRLRIKTSVAYGSDVHLVKKVLMEVVDKEGRALRRPRPEIVFRAFGESELEFEILVWLTTPDITVRRRVLSDLNSSIDAAFRRSGIEIPFPQRDLHIRSTPKDHRKEDEQEAEEDD